MGFEDLTPLLQEVYMLNYDLQVKNIILFGWFVVSLFYVFYVYQNQKPTQLFFVGTFRASMYYLSYLYLFGFFLIYPIMIHPRVPIDTLLLFLGSAYSILITVFTVIFITNFTAWIPKLILNKGKIDVKTWEEHAINRYFRSLKK